MAGIRLEGVSKRFRDGSWAVRDVSLDIRDGEFFVLVGPSGCGKSTLLNLIVGLEDITDGEVLVAGRPMNGVDPRERNMAMVFQSYAIYPHLSVEDNLAFPLKIAGVDPAERDRKVRDVAAILELTDLLDRMPATLSGGQRQRVSMGRAMVRDPVALLLDEPLSNLDAQLRGQMRNEIARLHRRMGATTIYVTHDQTEALTLADRMAVLHGGRVQQVGTPRDIYRTPATRFVAGFLGAPPMAFFEAVQRDGAWASPVGAIPPSMGPRPEPRDELPPRVVVGVRPEDVHEATDPPPDTGRLSFWGTVELLEWLGSETFAHVTLPGDDEEAGLVARLSAGSTCREGEEVLLQVDPGALHFFHPTHGGRLRGGGTSVHGSGP